ncbi:putative serine protease HhoA precursor [Thalassoglobus neptunius]|uniref:Putative serine protease HhoA n=1 Tax=Thalassoglobus neptunius TaxID=1938619 RepID=A0A5C5WH44_9PLAN|nr:trypsin-like peptidase domain-containing protein [Thalassoglobus neptunius]TWT49867.1 putative serine protease HhoA precursor [Thalassoglobus neptunius]
MNRRLIPSTFVFLIFIAHTAIGQDEQRWPVAIDRVPDAFTKPAPTSVGDLRQMQDHLSTLVPLLKECTVNLSVGGAQGSGVIVDPKGLILSAAHVTGPPGRPVSIVTNDGKTYRGKTLGRNVILDASMVQITSTRDDWPYCELAEQAASPGDWCLVLAHPGGYQVARGQVLRLGRVILQNRWLIQSDCELVGGDSGGPLFGIDGKLIGINTRIGESTDLNFHVPASAYADGWERFVAGEDFRTHSGAYLGIVGKVNPSGTGLMITDVLAGEPADRAGVEQGDILLTFENRRIRSFEQLRDLIGEEPPGKSVSLELLRDEEIINVKARLGMRWD